MEALVRRAKLKDIGSIMKIEEEMYGSSYTKVTFENNIKHFPEGAFVAEAKGKIVGFAIIELVDQIMAIPYVHDIQKFHSPNGKVIYLQGFGVKPKYQQTGVGKMLYEEIIKMGKKKGCTKFVVLCNEEESEDEYEISVLKDLKFSKLTRTSWEIAPGIIRPHDIWIKNL